VFFYNFWFVSAVLVQPIWQACITNCTLLNRLYKHENTVELIVSQTALPVTRSSRTCDAISLLAYACVTFSRYHALFSSRFFLFVFLAVFVSWRNTVPLTPHQPKYWGCVPGIPGGGLTPVRLTRSDSSKVSCCVAPMTVTEKMRFCLSGRMKRLHSCRAS